MSLSNAAKQMNGLCNHDVAYISRSEFLSRLGDIIASNSRKGTQTGLILIELTDFWRINIACGYVAGERILSEVAWKIESIFESATLISKIADEQFSIVFNDANNPVKRQLAIERCYAALKDISALKEEMLQLNPAITAVVVNEDNLSAEDLLINAEKKLKMQDAEHMSNDSNVEHAQWEVEQCIRRTTENNGIDYKYQPKLNLKSGNLDGAEVLIDFNSFDAPGVNNEDIIKIAEEIGLGPTLTNRVIHRAVRGIKDFCHHKTCPTLSVNISPRDLYDKNFVNTVESSLRIWNTPPELLTLEVTESALMENPESAIAILNKMRDRGLRIAIDDFGTGFSSLEYLKDIPANELKIDRTFISTLTNDNKVQAIVESTINLGKKLGMTVVAEGVENEHTLQLLKQFEADVIQGYWISRPLSKKDFLEWLLDFYQEKKSSPSSNRLK